MSFKGVGGATPALKPQWGYGGLAGVSTDKLLYEL